MQKVFEARSARQGRVVRGRLRDIKLIAGQSNFEAEVRRRGYHAVQNGDQVIVFCNNQPARFMC